jgi:BirA family biotin operon repressor/biotin-[acetyl-CoA-carboxylase] ligase
MLQAPALLVADSQSAGRGRGTNTWWSASGNITVTFVLSQNPHVAFGLAPLLAGLAVRRALVRLTGREEIGLKWPNDLVVGQRKTAGLLCERLRQVDLIGVGVNVNTGRREAPEELQDRFTSLREIAGCVWNLTDVVGEINQALNCVFSVTSKTAAQEMLQEYAIHHWPTNKDIKVIDTDQAPCVRGRCVGIGPQGRLLVKSDQATYALITGSVVSVTSATDSD